jgi:hypothetical protein
MRSAEHWNTRAALLLAVLAVATMPATMRAAAKRQGAPEAAARFTNGAPSLDALVGHFMQALEKKDKDEMRALRVTENEYLEILLPGSVDAGKPLRQYDHHDQGSQYFWSILNTKSIFIEANLIATFGGEPLTLKSIKYRKGVKEYAAYKAYKQLSLFVERGDGTEDEVRIGSVAELNGTYKFISYVRD